MTKKQMQNSIVKRCLEQDKEFLEFLDSPEVQELWEPELIREAKKETKKAMKQKIKDE